MSDSETVLLERPMILGWLVGADGADAARRGIPAEANPFASWSQAGALWLDGWRQAKDQSAVSR